MMQCGGMIPPSLPVFLILPLPSPETVCCELVKDSPDWFTLAILFFILCAVLALTGLLALLMD